jgi:hypothetical protein
MGKLVWLASYPKSGNTWVRAFLHNYLRQPTAPHDINRLHEMTLGESDAVHFAVHDPRPASRYSIEEVQALRPRVHRDFMSAYPDLVFVKTHNASLVVHGVPLVTPEVTAGAIYVVRDPRDIAVSYARHLGRPVDEVISLMADPQAAIGGDDAHVYEGLGSWSIHVHFWTRRPNPRLHVMRFEDMIEEPERAFGDLVRFLGQEPPPARLATAIAFSSLEVLRAQEQGGGFVERPAGTSAFFGSGRPGVWRDALTAAQAARIESDHATEMARFKYA